MASHLLRWTPRGYAESQRRPRGAPVDVLTPPSILAVLKAGYSAALARQAPRRRGVIITRNFAPDQRSRRPGRAKWQFSGVSPDVRCPPLLQRRRDYAGPGAVLLRLPAVLSSPRGSWAALGILLWLPQYFGVLTLPTHFSALDWHIHEMLYGYVAAAIAGFLLTAIPNWTGRLPVNGWPLAGLAALWLAGRIAILVSAEIGGVAAALIDVSFLRDAGRGRRARNRRRQELAQLARSHRARRADPRQYRVPRRGAAPWRGRLRHPHRHCRGHSADLADRRPHRAELHRQLADAQQSRPAAGAVLALRYGDHRRERARAARLDRGAGACRHRRAAAARRAACKLCGSPAGPATARSPTGSCWCCMSATPSCRSASCCIGASTWFAAICRRAPASMPGPQVPSG